MATTEILRESLDTTKLCKTSPRLRRVTLGQHLLSHSLCLPTNALANHTRAHTYNMSNIWWCLKPVEFAALAIQHPHIGASASSKATHKLLIPVACSPSEFDVAGSAPEPARPSAGPPEHGDADEASVSSTESDYSDAEPVQMALWAHVWSSNPFACAIAAALCAAWPQQLDVLELGAGLAAPSLAAVSHGAKSCTATDCLIEAEPAVLAAAGAAAAGSPECAPAPLTYACLDWTEPDDGARFRASAQLVIGSDVLYRHDLVPHLLDTIRTALSAQGIAVLVDPGRPALHSLLAACHADPRMLINHRVLRNACAPAEGPCLAELHVLVLTHEEAAGSSQPGPTPLAADLMQGVHTCISQLEAWCQEAAGSAVSSVAGKEWVTANS